MPLPRKQKAFVIGIYYLIRRTKYKYLKDSCGWIDMEKQKYEENANIL